MRGLEALAARCGIEPGFEDARGALQRTAPDTRRALLAAMGFAAAGDADAEAEAERALRSLEDLDWRRPLTPVSVWYPDDARQVELRLPAASGMVAWRVSLEAGGERCGAVPFDSLPLLDQCVIDGVPLEHRRLALDCQIPLGYHRLTVEPGAGHASLIVSPGKCWLPPPVAAGRRLWGVSAQLYLLRSARNWGIGDYGDLRRLVEMFKRRGADVVGVNPLHALFVDDPNRASPYSPASRLMLNVLNIDVEAVPELEYSAEARALLGSTGFQRALMACREAKQVNYVAVADLKLQVLRLLFTASRSGGGAIRAQQFEEFRRRSGALLERGCLFLALRQHFAEQGAGGADWHTWPAEYQDPDSDAVAAFGERRAVLVSFHAWLQFIADGQLGAAAQACTSMAVGLYRDLAVGAGGGGAETWSNQAAVVRGATVGAPPDIYNPPGQNWGLPPFNPHALREEAYRSFIDLIRTNMRHAGGLRIDHVMGLQQLYWIPEGKPPAQGAYVRYPLRDLVGILALESQRHRCLVVGEDLGTVPAGFRECMADANILSYRVLLFERDASGFAAPDRFPRLAFAVAGSHDLPPLRAWWHAGDLELKEQLRLFPQPEDAERAWMERQRDRLELLEAFRRAGLDADADMDDESLVRCAHAFLARTAAAFALVQLDDITGESTPVNVPTTATEYPNWRRRQSLTLDQLARHPRLAALTEIFRQERGPAPGMPPPAASRAALGRSV